MHTMPTNYYELLSFGLQGASFQEFVDRFQDQYNTLNADGFVWDSEIQLDYTYEQLITSMGIKTLPVYVNETSQGLDVSKGEFKIGSNKIPTQKQRYPVDAKILRESLIMAQRFQNAQLSQGMQDALLNLLYNIVDTLLAGRTNAITHQRMQIVSKGEFTIDVTNNPRGLSGLTFQFEIPTENKDTLSGDSRWWTNAEHTTANEGKNADPLLYLKKKVKEMRKKSFPRGHFEMSVDLFDDLLLHTKVLQRVGLAAASNLSAATSPTAAGQVYAENLTDDVKKSFMERIIGCPIVVRDTLAAVDVIKDGLLQPQTIENFEPTNVAWVPDGRIGTIKSVQPLWMPGDPTTRVAWFDGGRTLITNHFNSETKSMYVESEMAVLCVPQVPQYMCVYKVTV